VKLPTPTRPRNAADACVCLRSRAAFGSCILPTALTSCIRVSQVPVVPAELSLWDEYWGGRLPLNALTDGLRGLRESGAQVTSRAGDVLALGDERVREGRL